MLLDNSVINENETQVILNTILNEIKELLQPLGLCNIRIYYIEGKYYIFSEIEVFKLRKMREIYKV